MASNNPLEGLDITAEEVHRIEKALKDEKFRKMFLEYAEEISNPENRRKYEEEIREMERSRGMDVKFIRPEPGYVLKTNVDGEMKAFINICKNDIVGKPTAQKTSQGTGISKTAGVQWSVPYSLAPGREDLDRGGKKCMVYDCVFHPECFELINKDNRFRTLMEDTAMDGIEREFKVKLDRNNIKKPKMQFKGQPTATVIRTPNKEGPTGENSLSALNLDYPYDKPKENNVPNVKAKSASKISGNRNTEKSNSKLIEEVEKSKSGKAANDGFVEPKYTIVHRGHFDMQQFTFARDSMPSTRPQELTIKIELPLLKSAAQVQLDVFEKRIFLESKRPASYRLDLPLPYPVDEEQGGAKFDKSKSCLIVTLPVLSPDIPTMPSFAESSEPRSLVEEVQSTESLVDTALRTNGDVAMETEVKDDSESSEEEKIMEKARGQSEDEKCCVEADNEDGGITKAEVQPSESTKECESSENAAATPLDVILENEVEPQSDSTAKMMYPSYEFHQTEEAITLIIQESGIDASSVKTDVSPSGEMMTITFASTKKEDDEKVEEAEKEEEGEPTKQFCLVVHCQEDQSLSTDMKVDVSEANMVVSVQKKEGCGQIWSGFQAGHCEEDLQERKFLTDESLSEMLSNATVSKSPKSVTTCCTVTELTNKSLKADFTVTRSADTAPDLKPLDDDASKVVHSVTIPALDLHNHNDTAMPPESDTSPQSDSMSSPSTPSLPPGLKSAIRKSRRRACKSVSFSEEVVVEMFLDGPNKCHKGRDGGKRKGRRSPYFGPRRRIEKLKDNSQESYSDSELLRCGREETDHGNDNDHHDDHDAPEWDWQPDHVFMRQSSSESEGPEVPTSPRSKGKKSKGARRRRKEKARREANSHANDGNVDDSCNGIDGNSIQPKVSVDLQESSNPEETTPTEQKSEGGDCNGDTNVSSQEPTSRSVSENGDAQNNNTKVNGNDEELPLELQNHKTTCAFEFSNQVIFELDD